MILDRKKLTLTKFFKSKTQTIRKCDVFSKVDFNNKMKELTNTYKKLYNEKIMDNKI